MAPCSKGTTFVTRRVVVTVLLASIGASACSRSNALRSAKPSSGDPAGSGTDIRHGRPRPGELHVLVVDRTGAPLSGVSVSADYQKNSTGMASTCCFDESLGERTTGRDGVAVLDAPPRDVRSYKITASRPGWPPQSVSSGRYAGTDVRDVWGRVVITLGPAREIRGRVELSADCPPGFVEVSGALPMVRALVDSDGQFVLRGLSPNAVNVSFSACGRAAGATVEPGTSAPVVLTLPPRKPGNWPFDVPLSAPPRTPSASSAPPTATLPCLQPSGELVAAGDFDSIVLDKDCRFVLAGKRGSISSYESSTWTLLRPDGTKVPIGASLRGSPDIGENVVYLSVPSDQTTTTEIVNFVRGTREVVLPPARFVPALHDATVLVRPAITQAGSQAHELEIRWPDGTRRKLQGPVLESSLLRNNRFLLYGVVPGKRSVEDVHLLDLETRIDRLVAKGAEQAASVDDGGALVIRESDQLVVYDIERNTRDVLRGPSFRWRVFGRDLALKTETDGSALLRTPKATLPLAFRWPHDAHAQRLTERYLFFYAEGHAVLVDLTNGAPRALASGVQVSELEPPLSGDLVALSETSGRALVASLAGNPLRAVGFGEPRAFSPDGRWLVVVREIENEITLAPVVGSEKPVTLQGWGGTFAPDAPALFFHTGKGAYDQPRPLYVTYPALGQTIEIEPSVLDYAVLKGGEVLVVVPPGGKRAPGVYRRAVPL
jgi:hypothetical protein